MFAILVHYLSDELFQVFANSVPALSEEHYAAIADLKAAESAAIEANFNEASAAAAGSFTGGEGVILAKNFAPGIQGSILNSYLKSVEVIMGVMLLRFVVYLILIIYILISLSGAGRLPRCRALHP